MWTTETLSTEVVASIAAAHDLFLWFLAGFWEYINRDTGWTDFSAMYAESDWRSLTFMAITWALPIVWIYIYYLVVYDLSAPSLQAQTCRCKTEDNRLRFHSQVWPIPAKNGLWPIALPYLTFSIAMFALPLWYMILRTFWRTFLIAMNTGYATDAVAVSNGRILQPRPFGDPPTKSNWRKSWEGAHKRLRKRYKDADGVMEDTMFFGGEYASTSSMQYYTIKLPNLSSWVLEETELKDRKTKCYTNVQPQDYHSPMIAVLLVTQTWLLYSPENKEALELINYIAVLGGVLLYGWLHTTRFAFTLIVIAVWYLALLLWSQTLGKFKPETEITLEMNDGTAKTIKHVPAHPNWTDHWNTQSDTDVTAKEKDALNPRCHYRCPGWTEPPKEQTPQQGE